MLLEGADDARLADTGLARKHDRLALALFGLAPAIHEEADLRLAADEGHEPRPVRRFETALGLALAGDVRGRDRLGKALELVPAQILEFEVPAGEPPRGLAHHHCPGSCCHLQSGRQVRRFPRYRTLFRYALA